MKTPLVSGLLLSQIGYELRAPMRALCRGPLPEGTAFSPIAVGNLQWIAGLNARLSVELFEEGSVLWREQLPAGKAMPYSFTHGIGNTNVRTWSGIFGSIGSGLSTNRQFQMAAEPTAENDIPCRYSHEDRIPHAGGFVSDHVHLRQLMSLSQKETL